MPPKAGGNNRRAFQQRRNFINLDLPSYPGIFIDKDLDGGDKIVLHSNVLDQIGMLSLFSSILSL